MRFTPVFLTIALGLAGAACRTPPAPPPEPPTAPTPPPQPTQPPLSLTGLTTESQTTAKLVMKLEGILGPQATGRELTWVGRVGDTELGHGTAALTGPGPFALSLPMSFGTTPADLAPYQGSETQQIVVSATVDAGGTPATESHSAYVRSPKLPVAKIIHVQSSKPEPNVLEMTMLLSITNPNPWDLRVGTVSYTAFLADKKLLSSDLPLSSKVPASSENQFEIPAAANAANLGKDLGPMLRKSELPWQFKGTLQADGLELPIDLSGSVKISQ